LPLAAKKSEEDAEYVHQLRVSTRRSASAIRLFGDLLPKRAARRVKKSLRRIRSAAAEARDLDILAERYANGGHSHSHVLAAALSGRRCAQRDIFKIDRRSSRDGKLHRRITKLVERTRSKVNTPSDRGTDAFAPWVRKRLQKLARRFFDAAPRDPTDLKQLHRFRIRGKEIRYAIELVAAVFPVELREQVYPEVERLQEMLVQINDHVVASGRLSTWADATSDQAREIQMRSALNLELESLNQSLDRFQEWWTPERVRNLKKSLKRLLDGKDRTTHERRDESAC
jgi:CHAD domain-containing protein